MRKILLVAFIVTLFVVTHNFSEAFASSQVKTASVGFQQGILEESEPGDVTYIVTIGCDNASGGLSVVSFNGTLPGDAVASISSGTFGVSGSFVTMDRKIGTIILTIHTDGAVDAGIYYGFTLNFLSSPNVTTAPFTYEVAAAVPVELTTFSGTVSGDVVSLKWTTATEVNNYGFEIERSLSAPETNWEKIGFINGNGNSNSTKEYSYTDKHLRSGRYLYRLKQIDNDGSYDYSNTIELNIGIPVTSDLKQNFPNPFNPSTTISFTIPTSGDVYLKIFNSLGEEVAKLVNGYAEAGEYTLNFDAGDLPSGMYVYQLKTNESSLTKKMLLLK